MTPEEIRALINFVGAFGIGAIVAGGIVFYILKFYVSSYLSEKAKNLATREDIAAITSEIERVRVQYTILVEELKARHQLRMAALDRRLQAHQEAFTLWRELFGNTHSEEVGKSVLKCQAWWEANCIYLEPKVRQGFVDAYSAAHSHNQLVRGRAGELQLSMAGLNRDVQMAGAAREGLGRDLAAAREDGVRLSADRDVLRAERDRLSARLADAELQSASVQSRMEALQARIADAAGRTDSAGQDAAAVAGQLADARRQLAALRAQAAAVQFELERTVRADRATIEARMAEVAKLAEQVRSLTALRACEDR